MLRSICLLMPLLAVGAGTGIFCRAEDSSSLSESLQKLGAKVIESNGVIVQVQVDVENFTPADFQTLARCKGLRKLTISGKTLNDPALAVLAQLVDLEELSTNNTTLTDDGYRHFAAFNKLRSLALFHPSWNLKGFTGTGLAHLKALPKLERLTFAGSTAGDAALEAVGQLTQLKEFRTWHTLQTQAGNQHLTNLTNLTSLMIGQRLPQGRTNPQPSFDESTIPTLAKIKSLEKLELFEARLSEKGLRPLKGLPKLKVLSIHTTDIPTADVENLRKELPAVKIDHKPMTEAEKEATLVKKLRL